MITSKQNNVVSFPTQQQLPLNAKAYDLTIDENTLLTIFQVTDTHEFRLEVSQVFTKVTTINPELNQTIIFQMLEQALENVGFSNERLWVTAQPSEDEARICETLSLADAVKLWIVFLRHYPALANFCANCVTRLLYWQIQQALDTENLCLPSEHLESALTLVQEIAMILQQLNEQHQQDTQLILHLEDCLLACEEERRSFALKLQHWEQLFSGNFEPI